MHEETNQPASPAARQPIEVSVIVVTWRSAATIAACLNSILTGQGDVAVEILVLDNAGGDDTAGIVRDRFPAATLIETGGNVGFAHAVNLGLRRAAGRYVMLLNPDAALGDGTLAALVRFIHETPDAAAVAPLILDPDGRVNPFAARTLPRLHHAVLRQFGLAGLCPKSPFFAVEPPPADDRRPAAAVTYACGAALLVPRAFFERAGDLDESIPMYFEDIDLSVRLQRDGRKCYVLPAARATHIGAHSAGGFDGRGLLHVLEDGQAPWLYFRKHRSAQAAFLFKAIIFAGSCARLGFLAAAWPVAKVAAPGWWRRRWAQAAAMLAWSVAPPQSLRRQIADRFAVPERGHGRG